MKQYSKITVILDIKEKIWQLHQCGRARMNIYVIES